MIVAAMPMEFVDLDPRSRLFVIAPHPDDEVLSFGGAVREHALAGGRTTVISVTDGEAADDRASPAMRESLVEERAQERTKALRKLGLFNPDVVRLKFRDGLIAEDESRLAGVIRQIVGRAVTSAHPPIVVAPWQHDLHPDHEATGRATAEAVTGLRVQWLQVPIWAWYEAYSNQSQTIPFSWSRVAISHSTRLVKREALGCFASQFAILPSGRGPVLPANFSEAFDRLFEPVLL
jgi:LmbE family N-acetylglucosaminyl deacetylase